MLVDRFGRTINYLRVSVTDRCDLRCFYCIPKGFKGFENPAHWLTFDELERVISAFARLGTRHFRITGGEPLLRRDLPSFIERISKIEGVDDISMTTNATQLSRHAVDLYQAGLGRLNVSLDSLNSERVKEITGRDTLEQVLEGLASAKEAGFNNIKINMVPVAGVNQEDIDDLIAYCIENDFILRLIELMPMGETAQKHEYLDLQKMIETLIPKYELIPSILKRGGGPARYWKSQQNNFTLGIITPMSQHFCETCNRVRLSVDGTIYACLGQEHSLELRPLLRSGCSDEALEEAIYEAINLKPEAHDFTIDPKKITRIMSQTGG